MIKNYTKSYDITHKKIKKHNIENNNLLKIISLIKNSNDFNELFNNPLANMYGFEQLKHYKKAIYSFNLCKNGGTIRLLIEVKNIQTILLIFISYKHYQDFKIE